MKPQHVGNVLFACGALGLTPPATFLEPCWRASAEIMGSFKLQELTNALYAAAKLDIRPPDYWLHEFSRVFEVLLPDSCQQDLANTALGLATLALWELPLWPLLWTGLWQSLPRDFASWDADCRLLAQQLYQVYQAAKLEQSGLPEPDPVLLAAVRKCWTDQVQGSSKLHEEVSAALKRMGVAHTNEHWCERSERGIDIAIEGDSPIAMEVDGPSHFLLDGRQDGSTLLRNRMLTSNGWRVVIVDYRVWQQQLKTNQEHENYLRNLLSGVGAHP